MSVADWVVAGVSLAGAGLAYVGARRGSRPDAEAVTQSERAEWGRRFSEAIDLMTDPSPQRRSMGRALVDALLDSDLAQEDDRRIARALLRATALSSVPPELAEQLSRPPGDPAARRTALASTVDDLAVIEENGPHEASEPAREDER